MVGERRPTTWLASVAAGLIIGAVESVLAIADLRVELAIGVGARAALAKAVVRVGVHYMVFVEGS